MMTKKQRAAYNRKQRAANRAKGLCYCGNEVEGEYSECKRCRDRDRKWRKANPDRWKRYTDAPKMKVIEAYGGKCVCCGEDYPPFLEIDHIYGDGAKDRKETGGGRALYLYLQREGYPKDRYQLLCANCNRAKRLKSKCPCKEERKRAA